MLDEDGHPIDIKPYDRNVATKLIEDFMLIANETVAEDYFWQEIPFVYRTHDKPDSEKIAKLSTFINNFGYTLHIGADEGTPKGASEALMKVDGTDEESPDKQTDTALYEAGTIYNSMYRTFWTGGELLLSLYITNPQIS